MYRSHQQVGSGKDLQQIRQQRLAGAPTDQRRRILMQALRTSSCRSPRCLAILGRVCTQRQFFLDRIFRQAGSFRVVLHQFIGPSVSCIRIPNGVNGRLHRGSCKR
jgi:hypothetical protein